MDLFLYSFISWLLISFIGNLEILHETRSSWFSFHNSLPPLAIAITYIISGALTKNILINSGDHSSTHEFHNEEIYHSDFRKKNTIAGLYDLKHKAYRFLINPPLRLSIILFLLISYVLSNIKISSENILYLSSYFIGILLPHFIKSARTDELDVENDDDFLVVDSRTPWYQHEKPIKKAEQDRLQRMPLVNRLYNIITNTDANDARGIALIGPFGIGKSSLINMAIDTIQKDKKNYISCRINSWGSYESEHQIQRNIIEEIISALSKITSTTSLSGLPSKYIHSLKGAQSLWLDALPLFDNHSSPSNQLEKINELLSRINHYVILIIEDIDRNDDAERITSSIASLIDRLNHCGNFRFILSIGENLNKPEVINRICRYKEFLTSNRNDTLALIEECLHSLIYHSHIEHKGDIISNITTKQLLFNAIPSDALLNYIKNPRDLKVILRQVDYDWTEILNGSCNIVDLLVITVLKHYEPHVVTMMIKSNVADVSKIMESSNSIRGMVNDVDAASSLCNYLLKKEGVNDCIGRLQSCVFSIYKYLTIIVERNHHPLYGIPRDQIAFKLAERVKEYSLNDLNLKTVDTVCDIVEKMTSLLTETYINDRFTIIFNGYELIPILCQTYRKIKSGNNDENTNFIGLANKHRLKTNNSKGCAWITNEINELLIFDKVHILGSLYYDFLNHQNEENITRPKPEQIFLFFATELEEFESNNKHNNVMYNYGKAILTLCKLYPGEMFELLGVTSELMKNDTKFKVNLLSFMIRKLEKYKPDGYTDDVGRAVYSLRNEISNK